MRLALLLTGILASTCTLAQDTVRIHKANHYLGIQANELLRQIFNPSTSTQIALNPYLLNYSVNNKMTGWGVNVGFGYTHQSTQSNGGPGTPTGTITDNNLFIRFGLDRKKMIGKKWLVAYGFDFLHENLLRQTETVFSGSTPTNFEENTSTNGIGPRATLNFLITDYLIIGTEASYYFKWSDTSSKGSAGAAPPIESSRNSSNFFLALPAVLYLTLKF